jgi:hypothetical protein
MMFGFWVTATTHDIFTGQEVGDAKSLFFAGDWMSRRVTCFRPARSACTMGGEKRIGRDFMRVLSVR